MWQLVDVLDWPCSTGAVAGRRVSLPFGQYGFRPLSQFCDSLVLLARSGGVADDCRSAGTEADLRQKHNLRSAFGSAPRMLGTSTLHRGAGIRPKSKV